MNPSAPDTLQCRECGFVNEVGSALCANCQRPLTAYAGQLHKQQEDAPGRLAAQVAHLDTRPPIIPAMTAFNVLFALFWPLAYVLGGFAARQGVNAEGTNYLGAAFGAVGPILWAIVLLPVAVALLGLAWATWTQRAWAWQANAAALGLFALLAVFKFTSAPILAFIYAGLAGGLAFFWFKPETKSWYGQL